ncbi:MAG TPA: 4-oxalomesaconate tautomerase [Stellaceae bacterium]|nr:4-oxalomesaconate tautomerase [Stellaceae bacterium]
MQTRIPCVLMRGGTSKGPFFRAADLPADPALRDKVLLAVMGSPDLRQIDGIGGADPLTSKVAIVSPAASPGADIDFLFAQVLLDEARVDTTPNCGNMLAGVGPFAIECGMVPARPGETVLKIRTLNTGMIAAATVQTPDGVVTYEGEARIDGVPGSAAPVALDFLDVAGSLCGALLPTGRAVDEIAGVAVTCIDNGMPVVVLEAAALGRTGYESPAQLNADTELKSRLEAIRLAAGPLMNLGDVRKKVVPKMCLVAPPRAGGSISTRTFIPHRCHEAVGVLGALTVATACALPQSPAARVAVLPPGPRKRISVEHPSGEFSIDLEAELGPEGHFTLRRAALLRTARRLFEGHVLIPARIWEGRRALPAVAQ